MFRPSISSLILIMRVTTILLFFQYQRLQTAQELQRLLQVMLRADRDHDGHFSPQELEELLVRLNTFGVERNRLRRVFAVASTKSFQRIYSAAADEYEQHVATKEEAEWQTRQQQQHEEQVASCHSGMETGGCQSNEALWGTWDHYNADGQRQLSIV